jgi:hypothetical protein
MCAGLFGYILRNEARMKDRLTREEHQEICDRSNGQITGRLDEIKEMIHQNAEEAREHRRRMDEHRVRMDTEVGSIREKVAVIRERLKDRPDDTGTFKGVAR